MFQIYNVKIGLIYITWFAHTGKAQNREDSLKPLKLHFNGKDWAGPQRRPGGGALHGI